jgi:hypothetical protein
MPTPCSVAGIRSLPEGNAKKPEGNAKNESEMYAPRWSRGFPIDPIRANPLLTRILSGERGMMTSYVA